MTWVESFSAPLKWTGPEWRPRHGVKSILGSKSKDSMRCETVRPFFGAHSTLRGGKLGISSLSQFHVHTSGSWFESSGQLR